MTIATEQDRARAAYKRIAAQADGDGWGKYRTAVLKLPVMLKTQGLAPTLHFLAARGDESQRCVLEDLAQDLGHGDARVLLQWVRDVKGAKARHASREIQRRLGWYKRMAQAFGKSGQNPAGRS